MPSTLRKCYCPTGTCDCRKMHCRKCTGDDVTLISAERKAVFSSVTLGSATVGGHTWATTGSLTVACVAGNINASDPTKPCWARGPHKCVRAGDQFKLGAGNYFPREGFSSVLVWNDTKVIFYVWGLAALPDDQVIFFYGEKNIADLTGCDDDMTFTNSLGSIGTTKTFANDGSEGAIFPGPNFIVLGTGGTAVVSAYCKNCQGKETDTTICADETGHVFRTYETTADCGTLLWGTPVYVSGSAICTTADLARDWFVVPGSSPRKMRKVVNEGTCTSAPADVTGAVPATPSAVTYPTGCPVFTGCTYEVEIYYPRDAPAWGGGGAVPAVVAKRCNATTSGFAFKECRDFVVVYSAWVAGSGTCDVDADCPDKTTADLILPTQPTDRPPEADACFTE